MEGKEGKEKGQGKESFCGYIDGSQLAVRALLDSLGLLKKRHNDTDGLPTRIGISTVPIKLVGSHSFDVAYRQPPATT